MDGVVGAIQSRCIKGLVPAGSSLDFFLQVEGAGESHYYHL